MSELRTAINSIGLIISIIGIYVVYKNSPLNISVIDGGNFDDDHAKEESETQKKNVRMRIGVYFVIFGTLLQLISNFIPNPQ
jgi:hypothetical protein